MTTKEFKILFSTIAVDNGFTIAPGGWVKESDIGFLTLNIQTSNFSNKYYLNLKLFIHGTFESRYTANKSTLVNSTGNYFRRQPSEYDIFFDLTNNLSEHERMQGFQELFKKFILPFTEKVLSINELRSALEQKTIKFPPSCGK